MLIHRFSFHRLVWYLFCSFGRMLRTGKSRRTHAQQSSAVFPQLEIYFNEQVDVHDATPKSASAWETKHLSSAFNSSVFHLKAVDRKRQKGLDKDFSLNLDDLTLQKHVHCTHGRTDNFSPAWKLQQQYLRQYLLIQCKFFLYLDRQNIDSTHTAFP